MYACLAVTCHLHFWQNDRDFLRATVVTRGWNGYRNKSQHRKSTLEKKILPPFQQGFEPATFQSRVRRSNHWAIPAPLGWVVAGYRINSWTSLTGYGCRQSQVVQQTAGNLLPGTGVDCHRLSNKLLEISYRVRVLTVTGCPTNCWTSLTGYGYWQSQVVERTTRPLLLSTGADCKFPLKRKADATATYYQHWCRKTNKQKTNQKKNRKNMHKYTRRPTQEPETYCLVRVILFNEQCGVSLD